MPPQVLTPIQAEKVVRTAADHKVYYLPRGTAGVTIPPDADNYRPIDNYSDYREVVEGAREVYRKESTPRRNHAPRVRRHTTDFRKA